MYIYIYIYIYINVVYIIQRIQEVFDCHIHRLPVKDFISMMRRDELRMLEKGSNERDVQYQATGKLERVKENATWNPEHSK